MYTLIAAGSVWAWLALNSPVELRPGWFVPLVLGVFGFFQTKGVVKDIMVRAEYLRGVEGAVRHLDRLEGWETFLRKRRGDKDPAVLNWVFWVIYLVVAAGVPFLVFLQGR